MDRPGLVSFDADGMSAAQRDGDACVVCHKRWPRPRVHVGRLSDDSRVMACVDCAEALFPIFPAGVVAFPGL